MKGGWDLRLRLWSALEWPQDAATFSEGEALVRRPLEVYKWQTYVFRGPSFQLETVSILRCFQPWKDLSAATRTPPVIQKDPAGANSF